MIVFFFFIIASFESQSLVIHQHGLIQISEIAQQEISGSDNDSLIYHYEAGKLIMTGIGATFDKSSNRIDFVHNLKVLISIQFVLSFLCLFCLILKIIFL